MTDQVNYLYAYWDLDAYDDFDSCEFLSLFVCLLFTTQNEDPAAAEGPSGDIFWIVISHESFAQFDSAFIFQYVDFNAFDDFDSFEVVSLFVGPLIDKKYKKKWQKNR